MESQLGNYIHSNLENYNGQNIIIGGDLNINAYLVCTLLNFLFVHICCIVQTVCSFLCVFICTVAILYHEYEK